MGTECLTVFQESWPEHEKIVVLRRNSDGDPEVHGEQLASFLSGFEITQGMGHAEKSANGGNCLAAQVVAEFKNGTGDFYLLSTDTDYNTIWLYIVTPTAGEPVKITIYKGGSFYWKGTAEQLLEWLSVAF